MRGQNRKCYNGILNHSCQNTKNGFLIFYNVLDHLVFFTTFCVEALSHNVQVLELCQMPDHIHHSTIADSRRDLYSFVRDYTSRFAKAQNVYCHRSGHLFNTPFKSVPKMGDKKARTNLIYVGNNPPERRLVINAEDYQWGFLAYAKSNHPFSEKLVLSRASKSLRRIIKEVDCYRASIQPLRYDILKKWFESINRSEALQLVDYIVTKYSVIDHDAAIRFFGSYEKMIVAMHSSTGSEYDLNEITVGKDDTYYQQITSLIKKRYGFADIHDVLRLSQDEKYELFEWLGAKTMALPEQIAKFLRMPFRRAK